MADQWMKRRNRAGNRILRGAAGVLLIGAAACGGVPGTEAPKLPGSPAPGTQEPVSTSVLSNTPAISGGSLLITRDDATAVAADADRDSVWLVDLASRTLRTRVRLEVGAEPGRVVEDADGKVHVALRRGGKVVKIDPQSGAVESSRAVCPAPRGMAYSTATDDLHVACAGGELVTLKARGGEIQRTLRLDPDLRDVVVSNGRLLVSRFRSTELLELDAAGKLLSRAKPRQRKTTPTSSPTTAWRMIPMPTGGVAVLHQRGFDGIVITTRPNGYGGGGGGGGGNCKGGSIVTPAVTLFGSDGSSGLTAGNGASFEPMGLAVDIAVTRDGKQLAAVGPASSSPTLSVSVGVASLSAFTPSDPCPSLQLPNGLRFGVQAVAAAYDGKDRLYVQSRDPAQLVTDGAPPIALTGAEPISDEAHRIFHTPTNGRIACASCHAEGGDDGHVWTFDVIGPRRSQSLRGGILATAPFHWDGDMTDVGTLMTQVFSSRMGGELLSVSQIDAVGKWLDARPELPRSAPADPQAVQRGAALFADATVGCASCHSGPRLTSNQTVDVGTGKPFQVPSLRGLAQRAPYMHGGCAPTLQARFDPACGGGDKHGRTSQLTAGQVDDLVAYLLTL